MENILAKYIEKEGSQVHAPAELAKIREVEKALSIQLPQDYVDFLLITNGYEGSIGESYASFLQVEQIEKYTQEYGERFHLWIIFIGTDGGCEMYIIDRRTDSLQFGMLPYV